MWGIFSGGVCSCLCPKAVIEKNIFFGVQTRDTPCEFIIKNHYCFGENNKKTLKKCEVFDVSVWMLNFFFCPLIVKF